MGYSCRADASKVADLWTAKCVTETGTSNTWNHETGSPSTGITRRFYEIGREQNDGSITGTIMEFLADRPTFAKKVGTFKIGPDGDFVRGPAFLRTLCLKASKLESIECTRIRWDAKKNVDDEPVAVDENGVEI
jgi:hypothetical protein